MILKFVFVFVSIYLLAFVVSTEEEDSHGYVLYCPCIGKFSDQAEHLLYAMSFAKGLNRTLVVPPFIIYTRFATSIHISYDDWFQLTQLKSYHKVVSLEYFLEKIADSIWPVNNRTGLCRVYQRNTTECEMKYGNPFGTFWNMLNVSFSSYKLHSYGMWNMVNETTLTKEHWDNQFPPGENQVLAFRRPPDRSIPTTSNIEQLQKHMVFSPSLVKAAERLMKEENIDANETVAVQILSGSQLSYKCSFNTSFNFGSFLSSPQCTGLDRYPGKRLNFTYEMCNPSRQSIAENIRTVVKSENAITLFVSTDRHDDHVNETLNVIAKEFGAKLRILVRANYDYELHQELMQDLVVMSKVRHFIGNCVDSFSSLIRRQRKVLGRKFSFFNNGTTVNVPQRNKTY